MANDSNIEFERIADEHLAAAIRAYAQICAHPLVGMPGLRTGTPRRLVPQPMTLGDLGPFGPECVHPPAMLEKLYPGSVSGRRK